MQFEWGVNIFGEDQSHPDSQFEAPCVFFHGMRNAGPISVGAYSYSYSFISPYVWEIGRFCSIGAEVVFGAMEHETSWLTTSNVLYDPGFWGLDAAAHLMPAAPKRGKIRIKHDVWVGQRAYIKGGVTLGQGCVVGSCAVVTKDVPPYAIVAGNPARIIRYRFDEQTIQELLTTPWWDLDPRDFADPAVGTTEALVAARAAHERMLASRASNKVNIERDTSPQNVRVEGALGSSTPTKEA